VEIQGRSHEDTVTQVPLDSAAVQSYLTILQQVISRMASNCASAKSWCVALVSAILVVIADKERPEFVWIALVPIALFLFLDSYYLGLERRFIGRYNEVVAKLHAGAAKVDDVFLVTPGTADRTLKAGAAASASFSVWPFYGLLSLMLLLVRWWVL
jgi:hypothetical protein